MRFPKFAIENHQFSIVIILLLSLMGLVSFLTMPRSEDPQVSPAGTSVVVLMPGATPTDLEELVVDPIEEVINELEDIKDINTKAEDGLVVIQIEFLSGSDPDDKYSEVVQKVNSIRNNLPEEIYSLDMVKWTMTDVRVFQGALISDSTEYSVLERQLDFLKKDLEKIPGIKTVKTMAYPDQEIRVSLDLERITQMNLSVQQISNAIMSSNANIPGGSIDIGDKKLNIKTSGSYETPEEIRNTIIDARNGKIVYLKDVADVQFDYNDTNYKARFMGKKAVFISASQKKGTNIFKIYDGINECISNYKASLPSDLKFEYVFDQSKSVAERLNGFLINLLQGLILVGLVVLFAVGFRASSIVILAIPLSILIGISFVDLSGFGIEQMSIAGLVIALGLLVDNAIVVIENITRFMNNGYEATDAAVKGTSQIAWAVTSSTATTVLAFVPIILMNNITGDFIRSMPATVVYTLSASLLISLSITPYLSSKFLKVKNNGVKRNSKAKIFLNNFIETRYRKILDYSLNKTKVIVIAAIAAFVFSLFMFPFVGVSFFPKAGKTQFMINIQMPEGTNLDSTDKTAIFVESVLNKHKEVELYATNIGKGNPRIYYNVPQHHEKANFAQIYVDLKKMTPYEFEDFLKELRDEFKNYPGARIDVKEFEQGPPIEAPIAIRVIGESLEKINSISKDIEIIFRSVDGTVNINNPLATSKTDLHIKINRAKAGMMGVPIHEIDKTVRLAINGMPVSKYRDSTGKEYDIVLRLPVRKKNNLKDFDKIYVTSVLGAHVPLKQLATIEFKAGPVVVDHYNLERTNTITADVIGNKSVNDITDKILSKLDAYDWPSGYHYYVAGAKEQQQDSFGGMFQAIILAVVGIFGVLVLQFRSYSQPMIVFVAIPLAIIGSILALLITGYSFSFMAFVGITSLVGIVVNNSILLVDYTNQLRAEGMELIAALKEAGETRFTPIILTTATTVGGLFPLTIQGGSLWAPMGWTIIGGLLVSTILTLVVVPVLYKIFAG